MKRCYAYLAGRYSRLPVVIEEIRRGNCKLVSTSGDQVRVVELQTSDLGLCAYV